MRSLAGPALFEALNSASRTGTIFAPATPLERPQASPRSQGPHSPYEARRRSTYRGSRAVARALRFLEALSSQPYKLLIGTVIPRPIAFITTVDEHGVVNAAPFSFFNCLSHPTIVAIGVENHPDMRHKDTDPMWLA